MFAIQHYTKVTGDESLLEEQRLELLVQASRFLASRVQYSENLKAYGYYGVMGPDEFQMMVNHNAYTNYMGKRSLEYALEALAELRQSKPASTQALVDRLGLKETELTRWREIADEMFIPYSKETKLFEQHVGYFELPHVDIDAIPETDFPLYHSWSYDRIYRNDMIKQPDVLMFMLLYNGSFTQQEKLANHARPGAGSSTSCDASPGWYAVCETAPTPAPSVDYVIYVITRVVHVVHVCVRTGARVTVDTDPLGGASVAGAVSHYALGVVRGWAGERHALIPVPIRAAVALVR